MSKNAFLILDLDMQVFFYDIYLKEQTKKVISSSFSHLNISLPMLYKNKFNVIYNIKTNSCSSWF
jgi:hypothetical protein